MVGKQRKLEFLKAFKMLIQTTQEISEAIKEVFSSYTDLSSNAQVLIQPFITDVKIFELYLLAI